MDTIRSRALPLHLPNLPVATVSTFLQDALGLPEGEATEAARLGGGAIGQALGYVGDASGPLEGQRRAAYELLQAAMSRGNQKTYRLGLSTRPAAARGKVGLLGDLQVWVRDLVAVGTDELHHVVNQKQVPALQKLLGGRTISPEQASEAMAHIEDAKIAALGNVNPQLLIPSLLIQLQRALSAPS